MNKRILTQEQKDQFEAEFRNIISLVSPKIQSSWNGQIKWIKNIPLINSGVVVQFPYFLKDKYIAALDRLNDRLFKQNNLKYSVAKKSRLKSNLISFEANNDNIFDDDGKQDILNQKIITGGLVSNTNDPDWTKAFNKLKQFKRKYGHCNVSRSMRKYSKLAHWVNEQRTDRSTNKKRLTKYKIAELNAIGFNWTLPKKAWDDMYIELVDFYQNNGHNKVIKGDGENVLLSRWVIMQRVRKTSLKADQIKKLDEIGFEWFTKRKKATDRHPPTF